MGDVRRATPKGKFDLYAVEGGTAAMCYIFKSLKANDCCSRRYDRARHADLHSWMTHDGDYDLKVVIIASAGEADTDEEIKKLEDPKVKGFVDPTRPEWG